MSKILPRITNFDEAAHALSKFYKNPSTNTYTLDRIRALLQYFDNPQDTLRVIHVAGTSGKTSTVYYIAALLRESGATVGHTVSPHTVSINERVQINLQPLPEAEFCAKLTDFLGKVADSGIRPSYFELLVVFAFYEFRARGVDYAVVEVGLGGLLDGTNVVGRTDKVCVITDIGLDHTKILGSTVTEIAAQKAGIVQRGNYVCMYEQSSDIMRVVSDVCAGQQAYLQVVPSDASEAVFTNLPTFQRRNFGLARVVADHVLGRDQAATLTDAQYVQASRVYIPGRMETLQVQGKTIILDGAHNAQKMQALLASIADKYPNMSAVAVVSFSGNQHDRWHEALQVLQKHVGYVIYTTFDVASDMPKRSVEHTLVAEYLQAHTTLQYDIQEDVGRAIDLVLGRPEQIVILSGSLYLLGDAKRVLGEML